MFLLSLLITLKPTDGLDVLAADVWQHGQKKCVLVGHKRVHLHDIRRPYVGAVHLKDLVPNVEEPLKHLHKKIIAIHCSVYMLCSIIIPKPRADELTYYNLYFISQQLPRGTKYESVRTTHKKKSTGKDIRLPHVVNIGYCPANAQRVWDVSKLPKSPLDNEKPISKTFT